MPSTRAPSWVLLVFLTVLLTAAMRLGHLPAALMLGPMISGIATAVWRPGAMLPRGSTAVAQSVLGCLIAHAMSPHLLVVLAPRWPVLLAMNLLMIVGIMGLGVLSARARWLPGTAGIWGMSPGGASAMVLLSESFGSDKRLVAIMQYLRLICATLGVIAIGSLIGTPHAGAPSVALPGAPGAAWFPPITPDALAEAVALAGAGVGLSLWLRKPTLVIFAPIFGGVLAQVARWPAPAVPPLVSAAAFGLIGWHIGLSFTRASLMHSARLVPRILVGIAGILLFCAALSLLLARLAGVSFLTAYMALNPGGTDVVMIMGASISVDLPLIMAMQILRLILVVAISPVLGRIVAGHILKMEWNGKAVAGDDALQLVRDVDTVA